MNWRAPTAVWLLLATATFARPEEELVVPFANVTAGHYQVYAQSGRDRAAEVNGFMNEMLKQYARYFANWSPKDGARVVVFDNLDDFRAYSRAATKLSRDGLAGYCQLKTDEAGNTFYELVTHEHEGLWEVLAHEGFHQFLGYELGLDVPVWLNEGMAQYFETSRVVRGRLVTGEINASRLLAAQHLLRTGRTISVAELLTLDRTTFYENASITYPVSWALVYYLMQRDGRNYSNSAFRRYLLDLKLNQDSVSSFARRFGRDSSRWQADFEQYILQLPAQ